MDSQTVNKDTKCTLGFPDDSVVKNRSANTGDVDSIHVDQEDGRWKMEDQEDPLQKEMATHSRILA